MYSKLNLNDQGCLWDAESGIIFSLLNLDDQGSLLDWEMLSGVFSVWL